MSCMAQPEHRNGIARLAEQAQEAQTDKVEQMEGEGVSEHYCKNCFETFEPGELYLGYCNECLEIEIQQYKHDHESCYELGKTCKEDVKINGFLVSQFDPEEIEAILYEHLKQSAKLQPVDCSWFIESDESWFRDEVVKKLKGGK